MNLTISTEDLLIFINTATKFIVNGQKDEALQYLKNEFEKHRLNKENSGIFAQIYFKLGFYEDAVKIYQTSIQDHPEVETLRFNLGLVYYKMEQYFSARDCFLQAIALNSQYQKAYKYLGLTYKQLKDYSRAKEAFQKGGASTWAKKMELILSHDDEIKEASDELLEKIFQKNQIGEVATLAFAELELQENPFLVIDSDEERKKHEDKGQWESIHKKDEIKLEKTQDFKTNTVEQFVKINKQDEPKIHKHIVLTEKIDQYFHVIDNKYLLIKVPEHLYSRYYPYVYLKGEAKIEPVYRKDPLDNPSVTFINSKYPMFLWKNTEEILFINLEEQFTDISVDNNFYIREEFLVCFDNNFDWKNGTITFEGYNPTKILLVFFKGSGKIVITHKNKLIAIPLTPDKGIIISPDKLIGWSGRIFLRPSFPLDSEQKLIEGIELIGEGTVIAQL